jgi:peptidoglycan/xylan/chitin deacetylase (PgdA/CDA1 family)
VAGCSWLQKKQSAPEPAPEGIIFATITPSRPPVVLQEGQRYLTWPTPAPAPTRPYFTGANELGQVLVLEYHRIAYPEQRYQRSPDNFRTDLQRLYERGYYPANFFEMLLGFPDVPAGKKPVVLTFDDSDMTQFYVLSDNTIDSDSAVGILLQFHNQHPVDWPTRATFFLLADDTNDHYRIFGQSEWAKPKVQMLVNLGMEVGSHTVSHTDLSVATAERIYWELAISQHVIEKIVPGYEVQSLSVPYGGFPFTLEFLKEGQWGNYSYTYAGNVAAWGGPGVSPFDSAFDPYNVSRLEVIGSAFDYWLAYFDEHPHEYYVSDGDPGRFTVPQVQVQPATGP